MSLQRTLKRRLRSLTRPLTSLWHVMTTNSSKTDEVMWELQVKTCSWNTISRASSVPSSDGSFQVRPKEAHWQLEIITERKKLSLHLASLYSVMFTHARMMFTMIGHESQPVAHVSENILFTLKHVGFLNQGLLGPPYQDELTWYGIQACRLLSNSATQWWSVYLAQVRPWFISQIHRKGKEHTLGLCMRAPFLVSESRGRWWNTPSSQSLELTLRIFRKY